MRHVNGPLWTSPARREAGFPFDRGRSVGRRAAGDGALAESALGTTPLALWSVCQECACARRDGL